MRQDDTCVWTYPCDIGTWVFVCVSRRNIIVNGIAPGPFPTWMLSTGVGDGDPENTDWDAVGRNNPRGRVGRAEDIAGLAIFLASKASGFTIGDVITCDGGAVVS